MSLLTPFVFSVFYRRMIRARRSRSSLSTIGLFQKARINEYGCFSDLGITNISSLSSTTRTITPTIIRSYSLLSNSFYNHHHSGQRRRPSYNNMIHNQHLLHNYQSRRTYLFLPTSISELSERLQRWLERTEQRIIQVKLLNRESKGD